VSILDHPNDAPIAAWLRRCIAGELDDLILLTGEGLRRLVAFAERRGFRDEFVGSLPGLRKITRGPKPARALRDLGLRPDLQASQPTTTAIIRDLSGQPMTGRRVGVQLYGDDPNQPLIDFLVSAGARPDPVAPYVYASAADTGRVRGLIDQLAAGQVDAIAFTSSPQVTRLFQVAGETAAEPALRTGLQRVKVAAVGPLVADALRQHDVRVDLMPQDSFFLKPLVNELADALGPAS
jgi:uroporphyrinogen-III synthase